MNPKIHYLIRAQVDAYPPQKDWVSHLRFIGHVPNMPYYSWADEEHAMKFHDRFGAIHFYENSHGHPHQRAVRGSAVLIKRTVLTTDVEENIG